MSFPKTKSRRKSGVRVTKGKDKWLDLERHSFQACKGRFKNRKRWECHG